MSAQTLDAIEAAILAHHRDTTDVEEKPERHGAVITGWVVAYEFSNLVDVGEADGGTIVGFQNEYIVPETSPNQHVGIAAWAAEQIGIDAFESYREDEDE